MRSRATVAFLLFSVFSALFLHTAWDKSPTWDEVGYFGLGRYLLETARWDVPAAHSHPPLAYYLHSLPTFIHPFDPAPWQYDPRLLRDVRFLRGADFRRGNALLLDQRYDGERLFFYCRATSLLLAAVLAWTLYRWGTALGAGPFAALLPLALFAFSPNMLAHGPLINTDFALATTAVLAVYAFRQLLLHPRPLHLAGAGTALGLALLSKLSGLALVPVLGLLLLASWRWGPAAPALTRRRGILLYGGVLAVAALVVTAGFALRPATYLQILQSQLWDLSDGHTAYLMGQFSDTGWWYYFLVALAIKTPLPVLLLAALGFVMCWRRDRLEWAFLALPPMFFLLLFSAAEGKNIGLRYLLPAYPFLFLLATAAVPPLPRRWSLLLVTALCLWHMASTVSLHPHHLAYFNELVGGPANGHRYLVDSNLDWGQDLKGLKAYMDAHGVERIKLSYFGTVDPRLYGLQYEWLPSFHLPAPPDAAVRLPTDGLIAVSATNLVGLYMAAYGQGHDLFAWLRDLEPVARIGYSIFVYDLPPGSGHF